MSTYCVFRSADVPPSYRGDYQAGYDFTRDTVKHQSDEFIEEEAHLAREGLTSGSTTKHQFWYFHGVLAAIADATGRCPHCDQRTNGPCDAAGKVA